MKQAVNEEDSKLILEEICRRVGTSYEQMDFNKPQWFCDYEWTREAEDSFIDWVADFLIKKKYVRKTMKYHDGSLARHEASKIASNYGWRVKQTNTILSTEPC